MYTRILTLSFIAILTACSGSDSDTADNNDVSGENTAYVEYIQSSYKAVAGEDFQHSPIPQATPLAGEANDAIGTPDAVADDNFSGTNVQVSGVDEADIIKFDGDILMALTQSPDKVSVFTEAMLEGLEDEDSSLHTDLPGGNHRGVITYENHAALISASYNYYGFLDIATDSFFSCVMCSPSASEVSIKVWDYADAGEPQNADNATDITIEGTYIDSRAIGNKLYVFSSYNPSIPGVTFYPNTYEQALENQQLIDELTLETISPVINISGQDASLFTDDCTVPDTQTTSDQFFIPNVISITVIDIDNPQNWTNRCTVDHYPEIFVSQNNIYLASYDWYQNSESVSITKFALEESGPEFRGKGTISGSLSGDSYHFGEIDGKLAVVNTLYGDANGWWDWGNQRHQLSVLEENDGVLEVVAQLPNENQPDPIGKPGELIYAVRFLGDRAYVVTFEKVDPLYVIDLSDPVQPEILGELIIDGFSDYLHPVSQDLVIGLGKNAISDGQTTWYQGLNLRLFDVSDPYNPTAVTDLNYGLRGSQSSVPYDPHAFSYLLDEATGIARFTIPMQLHGVYGENTPGAPLNHHYAYTEGGLYQFEVDTNNKILSEVGRFLTESEYNWYYHNDRAVINQDAIYYLHGNQIDVLDWGGNQSLRSFDLGN